MRERETAGRWSRVAIIGLNVFWADIIAVVPIYLDNNATTRVADEVLDAMRPYYRDWFGNPHSAHALGRKAHDGVEEARRSVAALIGAGPSEVIFTSCGTEGNAMVIRGALAADQRRRKIVATAVEHPSVLALLRNLEDVDVAIAPVTSEGALDLDALREIVDRDTMLVCVMQAQNETGVIHDVRAAAEIAHRAGALMHVDSVQAAGKVSVSMRDLGADFLTFSGHKFHAPKGIGAVAIRKGLEVTPLWYGGGQESGLRSGTEAVPSIVGLGVAAELARNALKSYTNVAALRDGFERAVRDEFADTSINGVSQSRLGNTSSVSFHDRPSDAIVRALDAEGICVSAGAACHSGSVEPSATMNAMRKPRNQAIGTVRFSLSRYTTADEIDRALVALRKVVSNAFTPTAVSDS
jgi:cysteine desulfurase